MKWCLLFLCAALFSTSLAQQKGQLLLTTADRKIIPEGIAIDQHSRTIYISSINQHKILKIEKKGKASDFIQPAENGFLEGSGLKIDTKRNWLWALSNRKTKNVYTSQLHAFDLRREAYIIYRIAAVIRWFNIFYLETADLSSAKK